MNSGNSLSKAWTTLCPPAQIYPIVMTAVILFNLYRRTYRHALSHVIALVIGTTLLWVLCAARLDVVAYSLLLLPVIFFVFLLALIFYDQSLFAIQRVYKDDESSNGNGKGECGCENECNACGNANGHGNSASA